MEETAAGNGGLKKRQVANGDEKDGEGSNDRNNFLSDRDNGLTTTGAKETADADEPSAQNQSHMEAVNGVKKRLCCYVPKRYVVTWLTGFGMLLTYSMRTNVGVTVVTILDERAHEKVGTVEAVNNLPTVDWDTRMIGFLHSVFYIGHFVSQVPGAYCTTLWPSHKLFGFCILLSSLLNLLLPISIEKLGYAVTCVIRCCQGLSEGLLYPGCYGVLRHWSAPSERSRQVSIVLTCVYAGAILGFPAAGLTTHYLGWQYVYYLSGGACILWYMVWTWTSYEKPSHHDSISDEEFEYLEKVQGQDVIDYENVETPWRGFVTSLPVWAMCLCHFARQWVFILMLTNEPLYLSKFGFSLAETGLLASLPHVSKVMVSLASGYIADAMMNTARLSITLIRKLLTGIGFGVLAVCFVVMATQSDGTAVLALLVVGLGGFGLPTSGWQVNHYDLSTRHASLLVAITASFGNLGSITVPLAVGSLTREKTLQSWDNVFYVSASIVTLSLIFYLVFGSGEQQPWANPPTHIELVQKTDPLARKPYKTFELQSRRGGAPRPVPLKQDDTANLTDTERSPGYGANDSRDDIEQSELKKVNSDTS